MNAATRHTLHMTLDANDELLTTDQSYKGASSVDDPNYAGMTIRKRPMPSSGGSADLKSHREQLRTGPAA